VPAVDFLSPTKSRDMHSSLRYILSFCEIWLRDAKGTYKVITCAQPKSINDRSLLLGVKNVDYAIANFSLTSTLQYFVALFTASLVISKESDDIY
jgi:hypothetical protein